MKKIERCIQNLLKVEPYYAHFFLNCRIMYDLKSVPTAGVAVLKDAILMVFNREFMSQFDDAGAQEIIKHEILHVIFNHVDPRNRKFFDKNIANIAQDGAINQFLRLPMIDGKFSGITVEKMEEYVGKPLERMQNWLYYYAALMEKANESEAPQNMEAMDEHGLGEALKQELIEKGMEPEEAEEQAKAMVRRVMDEATKQSAGNVPKHILEEYDNFVQKGKLPWQQLFANCVARHFSPTMQYRRNKINRRFEFEQPGKRRKRELIVGVCADSSGSVSDESYQKFLAETIKITKNCSKVYFVDADCEVQNVEILSRKKKMKLKRHGCGGTAYQPAIDKCMELKCDLIIYFGDFDTADQPKNPGVPFIWVGVGNSPKPGDFGYEIRIEE